MPQLPATMIHWRECQNPALLEEKPAGFVYAGKTIYWNNKERIQCKEHLKRLKMQKSQEK